MYHENKINTHCEGTLGVLKPPKGFDYDYKKILKELKIKKHG